MRPYRGLTKEGKWVFGDRLTIYKKAYICNPKEVPVEIFCYDKPNGERINILSCLCTAIVEVIPETVGQSTGRKDRNKKEAYAGDMVTAYTYSNWVIDWHGAGWKLKQDTIDHWTEIPKDFIIFSNIHQKK